LSLSLVYSQFDKFSPKGGVQVKKLLVVAALLAFSSAMAFAGQWSGYISDEKCATSGAKAAKASDWINPKAFESCAQKCVREGSPVVFVTEDNKILKLDADSTKKALPHVGHRVKLTGTLENDTLKINKISAIKMDDPAKYGSKDVEGHMHDHR
jgi:hypothetical protein